MSSLQVRRQRRILRSWIKWIPVVAIPFGVLFAHAWLNIQILRADYTLQELDTASKELQDELHRARVEQTLHQAPELLAAQADEMAFVSPKPGQREVIQYDPADYVAIPEERGIVVAQRMPLSPQRSNLLSPVSDAPVSAEPAAIFMPTAVLEPMLQEDGDLEEITPLESVVPEAEPVLSISPDPVVETPIGVAPAKEVPAVVLDIPENLYVEDLPDIEPDMGGLEVL